MNKYYSYTVIYFIVISLIFSHAKIYKSDGNLKIKFTQYMCSSEK
jgi:hypothetical protein